MQPVSVRWPTVFLCEAASGNGMIHNFSPTGWELHTSIPMPTGLIVTLLITHPDTEQELLADAAVCSQRGEVYGLSPFS
jgi:hypothetical protein